MTERTSAKKLQSLRYTPSSRDDRKSPSLEVLDQLLIPEQKLYVPIPNVEKAWTSIRTMQIRGAPLIAIVAVLGLSVDLQSNPSTLKELDKACEVADKPRKAIADIVKRKVNYLRTSRPTAVNLFKAMDEILSVLDEALNSTDKKDASEVREAVVNSIASYADQMIKRDLSDNEMIGSHGADAILSHLSSSEAKSRIVTICNTGSLATAGFGTALGVVRELQRRNRLESVTALETRPYNQGSRLTAFEIIEEQMPGGKLICDSMVGYLMKVKGVDACVVGADRVCGNGDTANKIGTYTLAVVAHAHNVPFYVAAPFTTLDTSLKSGDEIHIEERPANELLETSRAPSNIAVWNPAFDVTPAKLITGIVTEKGMIEREEDGTIDVVGFVERH